MIDCFCCCYFLFLLLFLFLFSGSIFIQRNTKKPYDKQNEQLSPKRWPLSYLNRTKYHLDKQKVKTVQKRSPKQENTEHQIRSTTLERSVYKYYWGLKSILRCQPRPQFLKWYKTFSWLFGSHDNPLTLSLNLFYPILRVYLYSFLVTFD